MYFVIPEKRTQKRHELREIKPRTLWNTNGDSEMKLLQNSKVSITWLIQQNLPRMQVPKFDGSPLKWLECIIIRMY